MDITINNTTDPILLKRILDAEKSINQAWKVIGIVLVFWMHAGFSMLEAGSIREKNVQNILFKNILNVVATTIVWWTLGYALAFGESWHGFIGGKSKYGFAGTELADGYGYDWTEWCFQWAFSATSLTIISGGMAERTNILGYLVTILFYQTLIYPFICHWVWNKDGWLKVGDEDHDWLHFYDYAGASVVHMVGGFAALIGCKFLGPREGGLRASNSIPNVALGTFILWMGWYGFNACSGDIIGEEALNITGRVMINTTISAASAGIATVLYYYIYDGFFFVPQLCNGILAGLVSSTAGCAYVNDWAAFIIGLVAAALYVAANELLKKYVIDDAISAFPVHGCGGLWGIISVGLFHLDHGWFYNKKTFIAWQIYGLLAILGWVCVITTILMVVLKYVQKLRVSMEDEDAGLDRKYHRSNSIYASRSNLIFHKQK